MDASDDSMCRQDESASELNVDDFDYDFDDDFEEQSGERINQLEALYERPSALTPHPGNPDEESPCRVDATGSAGNGHKP